MYSYSRVRSTERGWNTLFPINFEKFSNTSQLLSFIRAEMFLMVRSTMLALMWCEREYLPAEFWKSFATDLSHEFVTSKISFAGSVTSKVDCNRVVTLWDMHNAKWCVSMPNINILLMANGGNLSGEPRPQNECATTVQPRYQHEVASLSSELCPSISTHCDVI